VLRSLSNGELLRTGGKYYVSIKLYKYLLGRNRKAEK
jgi:hypothetical protein